MNINWSNPIVLFSIFTGLTLLAILAYMAYKNYTWYVLPTCNTPFAVFKDVAGVPATYPNPQQAQQFSSDPPTATFDPKTNEFTVTIGNITNAAQNVQMMCGWVANPLMDPLKGTVNTYLKAPVATRDPRTQSLSITFSVDISSILNRPDTNKPPANPTQFFNYSAQFLLPPPADQTQRIEIKYTNTNLTTCHLFNDADNSAIASLMKGGPKQTPLLAPEAERAVCIGGNGVDPPPPKGSRGYYDYSIFQLNTPSPCNCRCCSL